MLEERGGMPIDIVSVGARRDQTIVVRQTFG
jgi:adenylosuccinate synthase